MDVLILMVSDERPVATALIPVLGRYFYTYGHRLRTIEFTFPAFILGSPAVISHTHKSHLPLLYYIDRCMSFFTTLHLILRSISLYMLLHVPD